MERINISKAIDKYLDKDKPKKAVAFGEFPDGGKISGPFVITPDGRKFINSTSNGSGHAHYYAIDQDGNGVTLESGGHTHEVRDWAIYSAAGHDHRFQLRSIQQDQNGDLPITDPLLKKDQVDLD